MKAAGMLIGLGILGAAGVAYAVAAGPKGTQLVHGKMYTWIDKRGFAAADVVAQYQSLGFQSVAILEGVGGYALQAIWGGNDTVWELPEGLSDLEQLN